MLSRAAHRCRAEGSGAAHTGRQALLQLGGLLGVLEDKSVEVRLAADLELDGVDLLVLLDPGGCIKQFRSESCSLIHLGSRDGVSLVAGTYRKRPSGGRSR